MTFRKILVAMVGLCLLGTGIIVAATPLQKECKKVTKQLKKEGWQVVDKTQTLDEVMARYYGELEEGGIDVVPVIGSGMSKTFNMAQSKAKADATSQYAKMRGTEVKSEGNTTIENTSRDGKTTTKTTTDVASKSSTRQNVRAFVPIALLSRTAGDGSVEVKAYYVVNVQ